MQVPLDTRRRIAARHAPSDRTQPFCRESASDAARGAFLAMLGFTGSFLSGALLGLLVERSRPRRAQRQPARGPLRRALPRGLPAPAARDGGPEHAARIPAAAPFFRLRGEPARAPARARLRHRHDRAPQVIQVTSALPGRRQDHARLQPRRRARAGGQARAVVRARPAPSEHRRSARGRVPVRLPSGPASLFSEVRHDERTGVDLILVRKAPNDAQAILSSEVLADTVHAPAPPLRSRGGGQRAGARAERRQGSSPASSTPRSSQSAGAPRRWRRCAPRSTSCTMSRPRCSARSSPRSMPIASPGMVMAAEGIIVSTGERDQAWTMRQVRR